MKYRIEKIETVKGTDRLYVEVSFLDDLGDKLVHRNDFIMQIAPRGHRYTRWIDTGEVGPGGKPIFKPDPDSYEEYGVDVKAEIVGNIERYIKRQADLKKVPVDWRNPQIATDTSDPLGLTAKPGVAQLIGTVQDSVVAGSK